jgi:polyisoprenoid-binding protein YceI
MSRPRIGPVLWFAVLAIGPAAGSSHDYKIGPDHSRIVIDVGKSGVFSFAAGHTHEVMTSAVTGVVHVASADLTQASVAIEVDATALQVTGKGEPSGDVPDVERNMLSDRVLDVQRYPAISFRSDSAAVERQSTAGDRVTADLRLSGTFTLHGHHRPVEIPVHVDLDPHSLTAEGHFQVKQTDYGIDPISVAGLVSVRDAVEIRFTVVAQR